MKKSFLLPLLLLASGLFAQKNLAPSAEKNLPPQDPTQLQGPLVDTEPPTIVCITSTVANLFQTGQISLWDTDFIQSLSDNETPTGQIKTGIRMAGMGTGFPVDMFGNPVTSVTFGCNEIGVQVVELWAIDASGNADYCQANLEITDISDFCNGSLEDTIQVCVHAGCNGAPMAGVTIQLDGTVIFQPPFSIIDSVTGVDGCATIVVPNNTSNYTLFPNLDDDPLNGVTTFDLLLIAKHITGVEPLDNPYKMIAADANKSGSITSFDLVELRKLIMGIYSELPNNTAWRFVDAGFMFPNPMNPFMTAFPEVISVSNSSTLTDTSFLGIKVGDVDCTADLDGAAGPPDYPDAFLGMPDTVLVAGQVYDIPIFMTQNGTWQGYQFALDFDPQKLEVVDFIPNPIVPPGYWHLIPSGKLTTSWTQYDVPIGFGPNNPLTTIRFRALQNLVLKEVVSINNTGLHAEGYAGTTAEKHDLLLSFVPQFKTGISSADKTEPGIDPTQLGDFEPPTLVCDNSVIVNVYPWTNNNLHVWTALQTVHDNATPVSQIDLSLRLSGTGTGFPVNAQGNPIVELALGCSALGGHTVEVWARDASGNTAFCETLLAVINPLDDCPPGSGSEFPIIEICAGTEMNDGVEELAFEVTGSNPNVPFFVEDFSEQNSACGFFGVPSGSNVEAAPVKDDNPLNGVTTYDLVLIDKHIRGIEPLNSPYKIIAADADRNGVIDTVDILEFRKLMLGFYNELPNNTSWRFVPKEFVFPDPQNPFASFFPESSIIQNINIGVQLEFVAIKVGDVNNTAVANAMNPIVDERAEPMELPTIGQVRPNPTCGAASLPLFLPKAENLRVELSDLSGKLLWFNDLRIDSGNHNLEIPASAMPTAGMYVWRVRAGEVLLAGKLVRY